MTPPARFWPWPFNRLIVDDPVYRKQGVPFMDEARNRMCFCVGGIGSGKSSLLEILAIQDAARLFSERSRRAYLFIDVHGDTFKTLYQRLALAALDDERIYERVIVIDAEQPRKQGWQVSIQPLQPVEGVEDEVHASTLTDLWTGLSHTDPTIATRMRWLMYHVFLALIVARRNGQDVSLTDVPRFLRSVDYRAEVLAAVDHSEVQDYFQYEFPTKQHEIIAWSESTLDRVGPLVTSPIVAPLLEGEQTVSMRRAMDESLIVLAHLPKGVIGKNTARLLAGTLFSLTKIAAMSRVAEITEIKGRMPFTCYLDEAHTFITGDFTEAVFELRKANLEMFLAGQELKGQLKVEGLLSSVINTVDTHIVGRCGIDDATLMAQIVFDPDFDVAVRTLEGEGGLKPAFKPTDLVWYEHAKKLMRLADRWFYVRNRREEAPHLFHTDNLRPVEQLADEVTRRGAVERLLAEVRARYGVSTDRKKPGGGVEPTVSDPVE